MKEKNTITPENDLLNCMSYFGILEYFDGPLLKLYADTIDHGKYYFHYWVDFDEKFNTWLVYTVTKKQLIAFLKGEISNYNLIRSNRNFYLLDIGSDEDEIKFKQISYSDVRDDYYPDQDVLFSEDFATDYAIRLRDSFLMSHVNHENELEKIQTQFNNKVDQLINLMLQFMSSNSGDIGSKELNYTKSNNSNSLLLNSSDYFSDTEVANLNFELFKTDKTCN